MGATRWRPRADVSDQTGTMKRVPIHGKPQGYVAVEPGATRGAVVGTSLFMPDGSVVPALALENAIAAGEAYVAKQSEPPSQQVTQYTDAMADLRVAAGIASHVSSSNPHPQYMLAASAPRQVLPMVTGAVVSGQPEFLYDPDDGTLIYAEI